MKTLQNFLAGMILGGLICMLVYALCSCSRNGYGCRGNSSSMTGEGHYKRGSRLN